MRYYFDGQVHSFPFYEITEEVYRSNADACRNLQYVLYLEEKFAFVVENFRELEIEALANTVQNCTAPQRNWFDWVSDIHLFNRRIVNLLTTSRLYLDQAPQHLSASFRKESEYETRFRTLTAGKYDSSFAYRLLEALRNHAQHAGLPLSGVIRTEALADRNAPQ